VVWRCTLLVLLFIVIPNTVGGCKPRVPTPPEPHVRLPEPPAPRVVEDIPESRLARPEVLEGNLQESVTRTGGTLEPREEELINTTVSNLDTPETAAKSLKQFSQRGPYEWIVTYGLCSCMKALSDYQDENVRFSKEAWQACLLSVAQELGKQWVGYRDPYAWTMIEDLTATWDWAQASPTTAAAFFRVCVIA
jgi:hypothetical protein